MPGISVAQFIDQPGAHSVFSRLAGLLIGIALAGHVSAGSEIDVSTSGTVTIDGQAISYRAHVETTRLYDADGRHSADIVTTSYLAAGDDIANRPVIFLFNGGPIVPSVYLHLGAFSPYRVQFQAGPEAESTQWQLVENRDSLLDIADLVYVDPPMTGFSRLAENRDPEEFHGVEADAQQVADFIRRWLSARNREQSPIYIFGQSYGTMRAPVAGRMLVDHDQPANLAGVILFGQAVNIIEYSQRPDNILSYVVSLPTLSVIAQFHGRSAHGELNVEALYQKAWRYARKHYLPALFKGNTISRDELEEVAAILENFTGISRQYYIDHRLRISKEQFRTQLISEPPTILGRFDARYAGPYLEGEVSDPAAFLSRAYEQAFENYRSSHLGVETDIEFVPRAGGLDDWDWSGASPFSHFNFAANIDLLFDRVPGFRLFVGGGHYDLTTTTAAADYLVQQSSWPTKRVMIRRYVGGHMAYSDESGARALAEDMRKFIGQGR